MRAEFPEDEGELERHRVVGVEVRLREIRDIADILADGVDEADAAPGGTNDGMGGKFGRADGRGAVAAFENEGE